MDIDVREAAEEHLDGLRPGYVDIEPVVFMAPIRFDDSAAVAHRWVTHDGCQPSRADDLLRRLVFPTSSTVTLSSKVMLLLSVL